MDGERLAEIRERWLPIATMGRAVYPTEIPLVVVADIDSLLAHIDAQAERIERADAVIRDTAAYEGSQQARIEALEVAVTSDSAGYVKDCAAIRHETATAILREVEECLQKMIPATPSLDVEFAFRAICRKHGATV